MKVIATILLVLWLQISVASELRHGVSFELPSSFEELSPCELSKYNSEGPRLIPITTLIDQDEAKIMLYIFKDSWLPTNQVLLQGIKKNNLSKFNNIETEGKTLGEDMSYIELTDSKISSSNKGFYLYNKLNGWRLIIQTEYKENEQYVNILSLLESLQLTKRFPSVRGSNQKILQWTNLDSEWAPDCGDKRERAKKFFSTNYSYYAKDYSHENWLSSSNNVSAKFDVIADIDVMGYVTNIQLKGTNVGFYQELIEESLKNSRFQVKLEDGEPVEQKQAVLGTYDIHVIKNGNNKKSL